MVSKEKLLILLTSVVIGLSIQLSLEAAGRADSIGWWYTLFSALIYTFPIFILVRLAVSWRRKRATGR